MRAWRSHDRAGPGLGLAFLPIDRITITLLALEEILEQAERHRKQREVLASNVEAHLEQWDVGEPKLAAAHG